MEKGKLILSMIIFGTIGIVRRYIPFPSSVIALARGLIGVVVLLLFFCARREKLDKNILKKKGWIISISGVLIGFNWMLLFEAYNHTSVAVATICYYMAPVFVMMAAPFVLREKITLRKSICALVAFLGMFFISNDFESGFSGIKGIGLALGAALMYATVIVINQFVKEMDSLDRTIIQLLVASLALLPYVMFTEDVTSLEWTGFVVGMLLLVGVVHTGIAYTLYFGSMKTIKAQSVALFSYIDPAVAVILSTLILRENMTVTVFIGVVCILGAAIVSELPVKNL